MDLKQEKEKLIPFTKNNFVTAQTKIAFEALLYQLNKKPYIYKYYVNTEIAKELSLEGKIITIRFLHLRNIRKAKLYYWLMNTIHKYGFNVYPNSNINEITLIFTGLKKSTYIKNNYQNDYLLYLNKYKASLEKNCLFYAKPKS